MFSKENYTYEINEGPTKEQVDNLYEEMLGRNCDQKLLEKILKNGYSLQRIRKHILNSNEYREKKNSIFNFSKWIEFGTRYNYLLKPKVFVQPPLQCNNNLVFIDFRYLENMEFVIRNALLRLEGKFMVTFVCGLANYDEIKILCSEISSNIHVLKLDKHINSQSDYNDLLLDVDFWKKLEGSNILLHQFDAFIFKSWNDEFLDNNYLGAPCYFAGQELIINGGFSFRKKEKMISLLETHRPSKIFEDMFFSKVLEIDEELCRKFAFQEKEFDAFGGHKFWEAKNCNFGEIYAKLKYEKTIIFNILLRVTYRPKTFTTCISSIFSQNYENYNILISYDDNRCLEYLKKYQDYPNINIFKVEPMLDVKCFYNLYCNILLDKVEKDWIIFLDDDDMFKDSNCLKCISENIKSDNDIVFWNFKCGKKVISPNIFNIVGGSIASSSYVFNIKNRKGSLWKEGQLGDFEFIENLLLNNQLSRFKIDKILTKTIDEKVLFGSFGKKENNSYNKKNNYIFSCDRIEKISIIVSSSLNGKSLFKSDNFFNFKSNNILNILPHGLDISVQNNYRSIYSLNVPFSKEFNLEFPKFESSYYYKNFSYFNLYINNINNLFINKSPAEYFIPLKNNDIYVINLKHRTDRWDNMKKLNLKYFNLKKYNAFQSRIGWGWEGCARSHVDLVKFAKQKNMNYIIVAEDDFINIIHKDFWEIRLIIILNWLIKNNDKWDVFNGLPTGQLVDKPVSILDKNLGIIKCNGGFNTHFIIYNKKGYDKVIDWYKIYDPENICKQGKFPDLSKNSYSKNHLMAIDVWLSNQTNMVTCIPLLTNSGMDDSDIIGNHSDTIKISSQEKKDIESLYERYKYILSVYKSDSSVVESKLDMEKSIKWYEKTYNVKFTDSGVLYKKIDGEKLNKIQRIEHFKNNSQILHHFVDTYRFQNYTEKMFGNVKFDKESDITVVITSCNRWSYLYRTLRSFLKFNSYKIKEIIVIEDSGKERMKKNILETFPMVKIIFDGERKGQINRIIELWSHVKTKYIFHMEDDWEFHHPFFLEKSKILLENDKNIFNVWLREINDTNLHPVDENLRECKGIFYWYLTLDYNEDWNGFTWNPTLMKKDFVYNEILSLKPDFIEKNGLLPEIILSRHFKYLKKKAGILPGGFVTHIGEFSSCVPEHKNIF